jgi:hypothetical protein
MTGVILAYSRNAGRFVQAGIVIFRNGPESVYGKLGSVAVYRNWQALIKIRQISPMQFAQSV